MCAIIAATICSRVARQRRANARSDERKSLEEKLDAVKGAAQAEEADSCRAQTTGR